MGHGIKVLIIHNIAWSHYKALLFTELNRLCEIHGIKLYVVHVALTVQNRKSLSAVDLSIHRYPHKILFETSYDQIPLFKRISALLREIKTFDPDIVVLPGYFDPAYWVVLFYVKFMRKKVLSFIETNEFDRERRLFVKEFLKRIFVKQCDKVLPCGKASWDYMRKLGVKDYRIQIVPLTTDVLGIMEIAKRARDNSARIREKYGIRKEHNFIYVGRLSPEKNLTLLIESFAKLIRTVESAKSWGLLIVGDGPQRAELMKLVRIQGLDSDVVFTGGVSWNEVPEIMAVSEVLVLPSLSESWGLVVNEAMACGLAVVVSRRAGAYWDLVVEGVNGFSFVPRKEDELIKVLSLFVESHVDIESMKKAAETTIRCYTEENSAPKLFEVLQSIGQE